MEDTKIQYVDNTFNAWVGCEKISQGCKNCYAEHSTPATKLRNGEMKIAGQKKSLEVWGPAKTTDRYRTSIANWSKPILWNHNSKEKGKRESVFVNSLSDTFEHHQMLDPWRKDLFELVESCSELDWLFFTKRPENIMKMIPSRWIENPLKNVWFGTSVESQEYLVHRASELIKVPAYVRFLSIEPMLGPVSLDEPYCDNCVWKYGETEINPDIDDAPICSECGSEMVFGRWLNPCAGPKISGINWVIVGGESGDDGDGHRPCNTEWIADVVKTCSDSHVPVFVKQLGSTVYDGQKRLPLTQYKGGDIEEWPESLRVRQRPGDEIG